MNACLIPINNGGFAQIDPCDFELVVSRHWYAVKRSQGRAETVYAESAKRPQTHMHRLILGGLCAGMVVDHINGDGLDNRRSNLRVCTQRENSRNRRAVHGYRGVSWKADIGRWRARIMVDRREISLGAFDTQALAAAAYNEAAIKHHGQFAKLNVFGTSPECECTPPQPMKEAA